MNWKDTVLTGEQMSEEIQKQTKKWSICNPAFIEDVARITAEAQAKVSYKAGQLSQLEKCIKSLAALDANSTSLDEFDTRCLSLLTQWQETRQELLKEGK